MGVVGGHAVTDEASAYGRVDEGPWHTDFTGYEIGVEPGMLLSFMDGEVDRGASPTVTVSAGGEELARQRVYPNNPLRYGPLTIHANEWGYGATYALLDTEGNELAGQALIDRAPDSTATVPFVTGYVDEQGSTVVSMTLDMAPAVEGAQGDPSRRRIRVIAEIPGSSRVETVAAAGEMLEIGEGISLRIDTLDFYARLSVVDDWSVSWMYALFVLACASVSVSVLVPYRVVRILLDTGEGDTPVLRMTARHGRGSPEFAARLREALEAGVEPRDAHTEQPPAEEDE